MRALLNNFDPVKQVYNRLLSLYLTGHDTDKIEMIVLGGTWDVYPTEYKKEFIKWLYDACNTFPEFLKTVTLTQSANKSLFAIEDSTSSWGGTTKDPGQLKNNWNTNLLDSSLRSEWHSKNIRHSESKVLIWAKNPAFKFY